MTGCTCCGDPIDHGEQHHEDRQRERNTPDNLRAVCRRCHHARIHDNADAVDGHTSRKLGPRTPSTGPPSP